MRGFPPMPGGLPRSPRPPRPPRSPRQQRREKVFVRHPPVINHPPEAWHHTVPYPYRFKIDGPWLFILGLAVGGLVFKPFLGLAIFIALMRCLVWLCFRFPMTMIFFTGFFRGMMGGGRRW
jgi:hypothetical protein